MKRTYLSLIAISALLIVPLYAQQADWKILLDTKEVNDLVIDGDIVWASTPSSGLVKINAKTKERTFYQEHNSEIADNEIRAIAKGKDNVIWAATNSGVAAFDGTKWITYSTANSALPSNVCTDILIDRQGSIWVSSEGLPVRYDGKDWISGQADGSIIRFAMDSTGRVYAATYNNNIVFYNGTTWITLPKDPNLTPAVNQYDIPEQFESLACDSKGNVYVGTSRLAVHKFNGKEWKTIPIKQGTNSFTYYLYAPVRGLAIAPNDDVWVGNGLALVQLKNDTAAQVHLDRSILTIAISDEQSVWFAANGVSRFDLIDKFDHFPTADAEIPDNYIKGVIADEYGRVWLTSSNGPMTSFDGKDWKRYPMLPRGVKSVCPQDRDTVWFAYGINGVGKLIGDEYTDYFAIHDTDRFYDVFNIVKDKNGDIWFAKRSGLLQQSNSTFHTFNNPYILYNAQRFKFDKDNTLWIGTGYRGLASYDGTTLLASDDLDFEWEAESVWDFDFDSKGVMWCATNEGLVSYDSTTRTTYPRNGVTDDFGMYCSIAIENDSSFWVGTPNGLEHFDGKTWTHFDTKNTPLPDNRIRDVAIDTRGNLWIGLTYNGVAIYKSGGVNLSVLPNASEQTCEFTVIPNPAQDQIRVATKNVNGLTYQLSYTLIDIQGKIVRRGNMSSDATMTTKDLPNGTYTIFVNSNDGTNCQSRFIISR
jgi:ligand-binding sensor domain-containing protein